MSSSPSTSPVFTIHRVVKDAADAGAITDRALGMNMHGYKTGVIKVVSSANANPVIEVLFWSGEAGKFISRVHAVESGGFGDGVAFDLPFKAFGNVAFVKVRSGIGSGDTVTITFAGATRQAAESDVAAYFDQIGFTNGDDNRYALDPIHNVLHGPFGANEIAWGILNGERFASTFEAVTETTGYSETIAGNWSGGAGVTLTANQITAPDPAKLADSLEFDADAGRIASIALGSASDNTDQTFAAWVKTDSGTKGFRLGFKKKNGGWFKSGDFTATTTWQRFDTTVDISAGVTPPLVFFANDVGGTAGKLYVWGCNVYKDKSHPWSYRTNDTGADQVQAKDQAVWAAALVPAAILSGDWAYKYAPFSTPSEYWFQIFARIESELDYLQLSLGPPKKMILYEDGGIKVASNDGLDYSRDQLLTMIMRASQGSIEIQGATSGNGKVTDTAWAWTKGKPLWYGMNSLIDYHVNGLISEPKKKAA